MVTPTHRSPEPPLVGGFFVSAGRALSLFAVALLLPTLLVHAQPKLVLPDGNSFAFGEIVSGDAPKHIIRLQNKGRDTLRIENVTVECNCSSTKLSRAVIPPRGKATLEVTFHSDFYSGHVRKGLSIFTNEGYMSVTVVDFTADVISYVEVSPRVLAFTHDESVAMTSREVVLTNRDTVAIRILSAVDSSYLLEAGKEGVVIPRGKSILLPFIPKPIGEVSQHGVVELRTDHRRQPLVRMRYVIEGSGKTR